MMYIYDFKTFVDKLNEGLIKTYDIDKTTRDLDKLLKKYNLNFVITLDDNTFHLLLNDFNKIDNLPDILEIILSTLFNLYGWFPATVSMLNIHGMINSKKFNKNELLLSHKNLTQVSILFESKFDLMETNIPKKLYHLSIQQYENDILKYGLIPKRKSKLSLHDYDGRIYLCDAKNKCEILIPRMKLFYHEEKHNIMYDLKNVEQFYNKNTAWCLFEIDTKKANIKTLYEDPNFLGGYYYLENIKPDCIKLIDKE